MRAGSCERPMTLPGVEDKNSCGGSCSEESGKAERRSIKALGLYLASTWAEETGESDYCECANLSGMQQGHKHRLGLPEKRLGSESLTDTLPEVLSAP